MDEATSNDAGSTTAVAVVDCWCCSRGGAPEEFGIYDDLPFLLSTLKLLLLLGREESRAVSAAMTVEARFVYVVIRALPMHATRRSERMVF